MLPKSLMVTKRIRRCIDWGIFPVPPFKSLKATEKFLKGIVSLSLALSNE